MIKFIIYLVEAITCIFLTTITEVFITQPKGLWILVLFISVCLMPHPKKVIEYFNKRRKI